jgi:hypothetical protein
VFFADGLQAAAFHGVSEFLLMLSHRTKTCAPERGLAAIQNRYSNK